MSKKKELELIEKSIGHLSKAVVDVCKIEGISSCQQTINQNTTNRLIDEINVLTTTITKMQEPVEYEVQDGVLRRFDDNDCPVITRRPFIDYEGGMQ